MHTSETSDGECAPAYEHDDHLSTDHDHVDTDEEPVAVDAFEDVDVVAEGTGAEIVSTSTSMCGGLGAYLYKLNICIQTYVLKTAVCNWECSCAVVYENMLLPAK